MSDASWGILKLWQNLENYLVLILKAVIVNTKVAKVSKSVSNVDSSKVALYVRSWDLVIISERRFMAEK